MDQILEDGCRTDDHIKDPKGDRTMYVALVYERSGWKYRRIKAESYAILLRELKKISDPVRVVIYEELDENGQET